MTGGAEFDAVARGLWQKFQPLIQERIDAVERAVGSSNPDEVAEGRRAAHSLAGSLGSYGREAASTLARELERRLSGDGGSDAAPLIAELRRLVQD